MEASSTLRQRAFYEASHTFIARVWLSHLCVVSCHGVPTNTSDKSRGIELLILGVVRSPNCILIVKNRESWKQAKDYIAVLTLFSSVAAFVVVIMESQWLEASQFSVKK